MAYVPGLGWEKKKLSKKTKKEIIREIDKTTLFTKLTIKDKRKLMREKKAKLIRIYNSLRS